MAATPALRALRAAGVAPRVHRYRHDPRAGPFGAEAARLLGVPPARVFKTLVVEADPEAVGGVGAAPAVIAVVPVEERLDLGVLATVVGA